MVDVIHEHIEIVEGAGGLKARILGHRIRVQDVAVWHEKLGMSADEIIDQYPTISLADVYAALAYYWDHQVEMDAAILAERRFVDEYRKMHPSLLDERLKSSPGE